MGLINKVFFHIGHYSASHPVTVCWGALMLIVVTALGLINIRVTVRKIMVLMHDYRVIPKSYGFLHLVELT